MSVNTCNIGTMTMRVSERAVAAILRCESFCWISERKECECLYLSVRLLNSCKPGRSTGGRPFGGGVDLFRRELLRREVGEHFVDEASDTLVPFLGGQSRINPSGRGAAPDQFL